MNENEIMDIIQELEENQAKSMKLISKLQHKMSGSMGMREGYGNRFGGMMPGGYPPMGGHGFPGQMGFREDEMMERGRDSMGHYTRG